MRFADLFNAISSGAPALPYNVLTEGFETFTVDNADITSAICAFDSSTAPSMWRQCNGTAHTANTGPRAARSGTWFALAEATGNVPSVTDYLTQATAISIENHAGLTPYLDFYYHAFGTDIGTLTVEIEDQSNPGTWANIAAAQVTGVPIADAQTHTAYAATDPYDLATFTLADYKGKTIKIRFKYTTRAGPGSNADVAIDDVRVRQDTSVTPTW